MVYSILTRIHRFIFLSLALVLCFPGISRAQEVTTNSVVTKPAELVKPKLDDQTCLSCHDKPGSKGYVDVAVYAQSVHKDQGCTSCHSGITSIPHAATLPKVSCGDCHSDEKDALLKSDHGTILNAKTQETAACLSCHGSEHGIISSKAQIAKTCADCHNKVEKSKGKVYSANTHDMSSVQKGAMGAVACSDCHGAHNIDRSSNPESKLFWQKVPATCGACHEKVLKEYQRSVHGKAVAAGQREAPVCTDCHGEHAIETVKKVSGNHISDTCSQCHGAERITSKFKMPNFVVDTYMQSYHGLSAQRGSVVVANCSSCHTAHDILPSTDPASSIYPANLVSTCGKCHPGIGSNVAMGKVHSGTRFELENPITRYVQYGYIFLIFVVIGFMFVHNMIDLAIKARAHHQQMLALGLPQRLSTNERIQHIALMISFILLAYTGFALKFPQAWWASPFLGSFDWRWVGHRLAAIVFCLLGAYHVWYVLFVPQGRRHLKELLFSKLDWMQFIGALKFYMGQRKRRPHFGYYSYIEKVEYWALVWGSFIMVSTGGFMLGKEWFLKHFPKWALDLVTTVHYFEAILACLAILVWHFYFVIFDPKVYPMKSTWIPTKDKKGHDQKK